MLRSRCLSVKGSAFATPFTYLDIRRMLRLACPVFTPVTKLYGDAVHPLKFGQPTVYIRAISTSILTPHDGLFPPELLSEKKVLTVDCTPDLVTRVTNFDHEDKGLIVLAGDVYDVPIRKDIVHRVVCWQLAKRQQFRHGATMHGPKPRSHAIKLNKKLDLSVPTHKTKYMANYVTQMEDSKKVLLVDGGPIHEKLKLATQNLHYVNVLLSMGLNVYSILQHDTLVMSRDAVDQIVNRMHHPSTVRGEGYISLYVDLRCRGHIGAWLH